MEDGRYAPVIRDIRSQWHHRGAYLHKNVEICAADPRYTLSTASSGCISPLGIIAGCQCGEAVWCSRSFTPPPAAFRMTRDRLRSGWDSKPRTSPICILLKDRLLQNIVVLSPLPVQGINPSETTKLRTHTFHSDPESPE